MSWLVSLGLKRSAAIVASSVLVALLQPQAAQAQDLIVKYDQASLLRLSRPAVEIIIGNPSIVDVSVQNGASLVVTGKSFGVTNIIAIDAQGQIIRDQRVMVRTDDERTVNLVRGTKRETYACTPVCQPTLTIGDDESYFNRTQGVVQSKLKISESADHSQGGH
jgi:Pilus formation protein N terminal region